MAKIKIKLGLGITCSLKEDLPIQEGATIKDVLDILRSEYDLNYKISINSKEYTPKLNIFLNGKNIVLLDREATLLHDADQLQIITMLAGG